MLKYLLLILLAISCGQQKDQNASQSDSIDVDSSQVEAAQLYANNCAGCHGSNLNGNSATALVKDDWMYGKTKSLMFRNIKFGINQTEMAGFANLLSDDQIGSLVAFLWGKQDEPLDGKPEIPEFIQTEYYRIGIEQLAVETLKVPWSIEFVDHRTALISDRNGQLNWMVDGQLDTDPIVGTPPTHTGSSTGGYMDIALDPNYHENGWVYLAYSHSNGNYKDNSELSTTALIRGRITDHKWVDQQTLFLAPDSLWVSDGNRWGCRLLFDEKGYLFFSIGDMGRDMDSQDPGKVSGKIYRINADGTIPTDNPYYHVEGALKAVFSLGNRNAQGFSVHPETKAIWFSEHGPMGGDEINILHAGANYGWPVITYGKDYSGEIVSVETHQEGMEQPIHQWTPSIGVCPIEYVSGDRFSSWTNNLLVGSLAFEELQRLVIVDNTIIGSEMLFKGLGRVRDIKTAPEGSIYVVLNNPSLILKLNPIRELAAN